MVKFIKSKANLIHPKRWNDLVRPLSIEHVKVIFSEKFGRKSHPELEEIICNSRKQLVTSSTTCLYPGRKFRLHSSELDGVSLVLNIGLTDYFDYLCTNHDHVLNCRLTASGRMLHGDDDVFLSNAIGNVAVAVTTDKKIPILLRSSTVATFAGHLDLPGGHPEPDRVFDLRDSEEDASTEVRNELFSSVTQELTEELNIASERITSTHLIGLIRNLDDGRAPEMVFQVSLNLSSLELTDLYSRNPEMGESDALKYWDFGSVFPNGLGSLNLTIPTAVGLYLQSRLRSQAA